MTNRLAWVLLAALAACGGNDVDPRVIAGGGVGDGAIDGEVNVYVIDKATEAPVASAMVQVGTKDGMTDDAGLVVFSDVSGPQSIAVKATGYAGADWVGVDGANVTIPLTPDSTTVDQATLTGSIPGWDTITVPMGHLKAAAVFYSQSDKLGDDANNLSTPNGANVCGITGTTCDWTLVSRTGTVTLIAIIIDRDLNGTPADGTDDITTVIGYALKMGVTVASGVDQSGLTLDMVEAGNLETLTIDPGTPPAALTTVQSVAGIELDADNVIQLPVFLATNTDSILAPKLSLFGASATYRLTAVAQTASGDQGAQSIVLRQGLTSTTLSAGTWLVPPTGVTATRTGASFQPVDGAKAHTVNWEDDSGKSLLEMTIFDPTQTSVDVPDLLALPTSGALTARVQAIGADFDVTDFSLDDDKDKLWGISAQPTMIP